MVNYKIKFIRILILTLIQFGLDQARRNKWKITIRLISLCIIFWWAETGQVPIPMFNSLVSKIIEILKITINDIPEGTKLFKFKEKVKKILHLRQIVNHNLTAERIVNEAVNEVFNDMFYTYIFYHYLFFFS